MNKLIVDNVDDVSDIIVTEDMYVFIDLKDSNGYINFNVMKDMTLKVLEIGNNTKNIVNYYLEDNSQIVINKVGFDSSDEVFIHLNGENSIATVNSSLINLGKCKFKQHIEHNFSNTKSYISNHIVNKGDKDFTLVVNADVPNKSSDCYTKQDNRIINLGNGKNTIEPNLIIKNNLIEAEHSAYIGKFNDAILFYLQSRGIKREAAYQLLINGFLLDRLVIDDMERERIIRVINEDEKE